MRNIPKLGTGSKLSSKLDSFMPLKWTRKMPAHSSECCRWTLPLPNVLCKRLPSSPSVGWAWQSKLGLLVTKSNFLIGSHFESFLSSLEVQQVRCVFKYLDFCFITIFAIQWCDKESALSGKCWLFMTYLDKPNLWKLWLPLKVI